MQNNSEVTVGLLQDAASLGSRYNTGKLEWSLVDYKALEPMVEVLMYGAHKYSIFKDKEGNEIKGSEISPKDIEGLEVVSSGKNNWKKGLPVTEIIDSMMRHLTALLRGEDIDNESKLPHIGHIGCNFLFLSHMLQNRPELDNRYKTNK